MGSDEPHATPSVHEEIPATSAEENVNEELKTQAVTEEEPEIPQPMDPEIAIPEVVMQLTDTPQPKPKDPFSKKQKFKADSMCSSLISTLMTMLVLERSASGLPARPISILLCSSTRTNSSTTSIFLTWTDTSPTYL